MKKSINRIAFFNILSILLLQGISFLSAPLFARLLGTNGYGNIASYNIWVGVVCTVVSLQTNITVMNARVEYPPEEQERYQSSVMTLSLLAFALFSVLIMVLLRPVSALLKMEKWVVALILLQSFGMFCTNFLNSKFTYEFKADKNMLLSVGIALSTLGVSVLLVLRLKDEGRYFGRILGNASVYGAAGAAICGWVLWKGKTFYNPRYWKFCLLLSAPMVFQNLSYQLLSNSDMLMLKQLSDASASGVYSLAFSLSGVLFTIFTALNSTWIPFFFEDMKEGKMRNASRQARNFMELYTVLTMGFVLLVREVYTIYAPEAYWASTELLPLFAAGYYFNFLSTFPVTFQYFHLKTSTVALATISVSVINAALNYFLIIRFSMLGAAAATLLCHILLFAVHELYVRYALRQKAYPISISDWGRYALLFCVAVILFYALPNAWLFRWLLGAAIGLWEVYRIWNRKSLL